MISKTNDCSSSKFLDEVGPFLVQLLPTWPSLTWLHVLSLNTACSSPRINPHAVCPRSGLYLAEVCREAMRVWFIGSQTILDDIYSFKKLSWLLRFSEQIQVTVVLIAIIQTCQCSWSCTKYHTPYIPPVTNITPQSTTIIMQHASRKSL